MERTIGEGLLSSVRAFAGRTRAQCSCGVPCRCAAALRGPCNNRRTAFFRQNPKRVLGSLDPPQTLRMPRWVVLSAPRELHRASSSPPFWMQREGRTEVDVYLVSWGRERA